MLKEDYKNDQFEGSRKYALTEGDDGLYTREDMTEYEQEGDVFGAEDINDTNKAVNRLNHSISATFQSSGWSSSAPYTQTVAASDVVDTDKPIPFFIDDGTNETDSKNRSKAYGFVSYFDSGNGTIAAVCRLRKPTSNFTVEFKGV